MPGGGIVCDIHFLSWTLTGWREPLAVVGADDGQALAA